MFRQAENPRDAMRDIRNVTLASIFIDQIEEFDRDEDAELYETYLSRLSDPRGPRKLIAAANPGPTDHFIYKRGHPDSDERESQVAWINVTIYDNAQNLPPGYVKRLERRGRKDPTWFDRYCLGKWGAFGGKRFKTWNPDRHVIPPFPIPSSWEVIGGIDVGWVNSTRYLLVALDHEGRYYAAGEFSLNESPPRLLAKGMREMEETLNLAPSSRWEDPSAWAAVQGQPSVAEQLSEYGMDAGKADNDRIGGWARIDDLLQEDVDGDPTVGHDIEGSQGPRLRIFDGRMPKLVEELPNAQIKDGTEDIEKKNDHCLAKGTLVTLRRGQTPIEDVRVGDLALTRAGWRPVTWAGQSGVDAPIKRVKLSDGGALLATDEHLLWTEPDGWRPVSALLYGECVESLTRATRIARPARSTGSTMGIFLRAGTSTIATAIRSTIGSRTSRSSLRRSTRNSIPITDLSRRPLVTLLLRGIVPLLAALGIASTRGGRRSCVALAIFAATNAEPSSRRGRSRTQSSAPIVAGQRRVGLPDWTTKRGVACSAVRHSECPGTRERGAALVHVVSVSDAGTSDVYD